MKSILHVVNIYFVLPYFLGEQLNYFKDKGAQLHIICSHSAELHSFCERYEAAYKEIEIARSISLLADIKAIVATFLYLKRHKIEVVVGHTPKGAMVAMIASFLAGVKTRIYFRHGLVYETSRGAKRGLLITIDRLTSCFSTQVINVSPSVAERAVQDQLNCRSKQTLLSKGTCNGIDINKFSREGIDPNKRETLLAKLGLHPNDFVVGFSGRLVKDKGIIELVRAFEMVQKKHSQCKLLLVGMFEVRDALPEDVVRQIKENHHIVTTGYVDYGEIEYYYSLMSIFVLPSYREGFPTSVLEASSMQLPVITTKVTGCIDSIDETNTGLFVEHNPTSLAEAILQLLCSEKRVHDMGRAGRAFVENNFTQKIIWNELEKIYQ